MKTTPFEMVFIIREHMVPHVLGVGYAYNEYEVTAGRWKEFEIEFDYADNIKQAAAMLSFKSRGITFYVVERLKVLCHNGFNTCYP